MKSQNGTKKTLDIQHNLRLGEFQDRQKHIDKMRNKIIDIDNRIRKMEETKKNDCFDVTTLNKYLDLVDERNQMEKDLQVLEKSCDEVEYFTNTASILFKYYDIVEKGIDDNGNTKAVKDDSILKFFVPSSEPHKDTSIPVQNQKAPTDDRATLLDKYMSFTDTNYIKSIDTECKDICPCCTSANRSVLLNDGLVFCNECDTVEYIIVDHERPSYRDPPKLSLGVKVMYLASLIIVIFIK